MHSHTLWKPPPHVSQSELLGVTFVQRLEFSRHVHETAPCERRTLGIVNHVTRIMPATSLRDLYTSLVLSQIELRSPDMGPLLNCSEGCLESTQRRAVLTLYMRDFP